MAGVEALASDQDAGVVVEERKRVGAERDDGQGDGAPQEAVDEEGLCVDRRTTGAGAVEGGSADDDDALDGVGLEPAVVGHVLYAVGGRGRVEGGGEWEGGGVDGVALGGGTAVEGVVDGEGFAFGGEVEAHGECEGVGMEAAVVREEDYLGVGN